MPIPQVRWPGKSGNRYVYRPYPIGSKLKAIPGNYIFAKKLNDIWSPVFVGQTDDLSTQLLGGSDIEHVERSGATHIHAHQASDEIELRMSEESDIRSNYRALRTEVVH
jgi:hypothetical protein